MRISLRRLLTALLGVAAIAAIWFFLAPGVLGGATNYVFTSGISMQPRFHTGDLAVVRGRTDYQVGEIVAYRSLSLHRIVLHRIIARDGVRYVFKGDNNSFRDPEHPTRSQLVGKLWLHLPGVGTKLSFLRTPRAVALLAGLATLLLVGGTVGVSRRRSRRRRRSSDATTPVRRPGPVTSATQIGLTVASAALAAFLALGALAFTRPSEGTATAAAAYTQAGTFSYVAGAPAGAVYPGGHAETGDPLFVRLIDKARVRFDYDLSSDFPHALTGSASLNAEIASSSGWKRTLQLEPPVSFDGDHVALGGTLHLRAIERLLRRVETATAVTGNVTYTLTLLPRVQFSGRLAGVRLSDTFAPRLPFTVEPVQLRPQLPDALAPGSTITAANPLTPSSDGTVKTTRRAAKKLSFHGVHLPVAVARKTATIGAAAALCTLFGFLLLLLRGRHADEPSRIQARYRDLLIPVASADRRSYDELVELTSFDALARLAERYDRMILYEQNPLGHSYRIADEGVLYVYLIGDDRRPLSIPIPPEPELPPTSEIPGHGDIQPARSPRSEASPYRVEDSLRSRARFVERP